MSSELTDLAELSQLGACSREYQCDEEKRTTEPPVAVRLNANGCLSLDQIVQSFGDNPISEEQAWGILHQTCTCLKKLFEKCDKATKLYLVLEFRQLLIHRDGYIHEASFTSKNGIDRVVAISEQKILEKMAILVFSALERGLQDEYQRQLSPELEKLLDLMLEDVDSEQNVGGTNEVDEGIVMQDIEDEALPYQPIILDVVLKRCQSHLASGSEASQHFRNVCRALVTQALELSSFLQKTRETQLCTEELQNLGFSDWANLWQEMMSNLRNGVKLKKTDYTKNPIEFALTPYEMLMEDIRSRRYKLNKVMIDGKLPSRIKKDAHSLLLDFIRSRPPLKPVSERRLPPRENHSTPLELLMASIRSGEGRSNLRKTSGPPEPKSIAFDFYMSHIFQSGEIQEMDRLGTRTVVAAQLDATPRVVQRHRISDVVHRRRGSLATSAVTRSKSFYVRRPLSASIILPATSGTKRMIIPDSNFSNFDPDDDSDDDKDSDHELHTKTPPPYRPPFQKDSSKDIKEVNSSQEDFTDGLLMRSSPYVEQTSFIPSVLSARNLTNLIYDTYCGPPELLSVDPQRSISTFNLASLDSDLVRKEESFLSHSNFPQRSLSTFNLFFTNPEPSMTSDERSTATRKFSLSPQPLSMDGILSSLGMRKTSEPINHINFAKHNDTSKPTPKTSVTSPPSEFVHIRSTLNRAKFEESQSLDENLRGDILKSKVCFGCKKTRFYFFNRSHKCPWCNYTFCSNCVSKVNVREDFIDAAPLHALTPNNRDVLGSNLHHSRSSLDVMRRERLLESGKMKSLRESLKEEAQYNSSKTHLRRSNTIGRMDLYGRSDGQEPHRAPLQDQIQLVDILKDLNATVADAKTVQVVLCTDCAEVADQHIPEEKLIVDRLSRLKNSQS